MSTLGIFCLMVVLSAIIYQIRKSSDLKLDEDQEKLRRIELKNIIEQREDRTSLEEFDEKRFWEITENIASHAGNSYKNFLGLFRDVISRYQPEELIKLDNLIMRIFLKALNQDVSATATIVFKSSDTKHIFILLNLFMSRGEVFFKNAIHNPNLMIGKEFIDIEDRIILNIIDEVYLKKAKKLIPLYPEVEFGPIKGEPWKEKDLPSRYPELWMEYA